MTANILARVRAFLVRGLAVMAVVVTYTLGGTAVQLASFVGISTLAATTTATPAHAYWRGRYRRRRFHRRRFHRRRYYPYRRRSYRRRWWGGY